MNQQNVFLTMVLELGKLILRGEETKGSLAESAIQFVDARADSFKESEILKQLLTSIEDQPLVRLFTELLGSEEEPYQAPLQLEVKNDTKLDKGFFAHIFKGEQDISPVSLEKNIIKARKYQKFLNALQHDLQQLAEPPDISVWLSLIKRYTRWLPATENYASVSLYDYTRIKMALAACLTEYTPDEQVGLLNVRINNVTEFPLLENQENNMPVFRGHLYTRQILREFLAADLLEVSQLPVCNCIFARGDEFVILLGKNGRQTLESHLQKLEDFVMEKYQGQFGLSYKWHFLPVSKLLQSDFGDEWEQMKSSFPSTLQFGGKEAQFHAHLFGPFAKATGSAGSLENLADTVGKSQWLTLEKVTDSNNEDLCPEITEQFGTHINFHSKKPEKLAEGQQLLRLNHTDFAGKNGRGYVFTDVNHHVSHNQLPKQSPFAVVAIQSPVDLRSANIFQLLTRQEYIADFFYSHLPYLLKEKKYRQYISLCYMDQHAIYIITQLSTTLRLARQVYKNFAKLTQHRYPLRMVVQTFAPYYPAYQALYEQNVLLENSSAVEEFVIDGQRVPWKFFPHIFEIQEKLAAIAKNKGQGILFPLWEQVRSYRMQKQLSPDHILPWYHYINYYLTSLGLQSIGKQVIDHDYGDICLELALAWDQYLKEA